jgi:L,D-transpeptidase YcbB
MPGVRIDRFLASTAAALLLSAATGGALAEPVTNTPSATIIAAPGTSKDAAPAPAKLDKSTATPAESARGPVVPSPAASTTPAAAPNPTESSKTPKTPAPAVSATLPEMPNPTPSTKAPATPTPAVSATLPEMPNPTPSTKAPATPTPAVSATLPEMPNPTPSTKAPATPTPAVSATLPEMPNPTPSTKAHGSPTPAPASAASATPAATPQPSGTPGTPGAATPPTPAAAAATMPAPSPGALADAAIAEQLRGLTSGKFDHVIGGKKERASIEAFYSHRNFAPLWITDGHANARAKAAIAYLGRVDADGLDPADYPVPDFAALTDPGALAQAELRLGTSVVTYAHHAAIGRVAWSRVNANIFYTTKAPEPADVLAAMADAKNVAAALDSYEPHAKEYLALKAKLAEIRAGKDDFGKPIARGPMLRIGARDDRVPQLRKRLGVPGDGTTYDKALAEAVKKFQHAHQIAATGSLTTATVEALNGRRPKDPTDIIIANMERWRWLPHDLGKTYAMVNLPDFTVSVFHDGKRVWKTKIVVGKPSMPTPIMTAEMKFITVNPIWHVPPSIINNEYLPALAQDPTVMQRMGLVVDRDSSGRVIGIWQPPGDHNALGRIRFNFPNKFLVYQHDTPDKYMFAYAKRAFSHGCMRTQNPLKYAEVLLSYVRPGEGYTVERLKKMYGPHEINISLPTFIPVHITYQTAFVDGAGKLEFRNDLYGRDKELLAILHNPQELKIADIPIERHISASHREILAAADGRPTFRNQGGLGGFFERLFGSFDAGSPPPTARRYYRRPRGR